MRCRSRVAAAAGALLAVSWLTLGCAGHSARSGSAGSGGAGGSSGTAGSAGGGTAGTSGATSGGCAGVVEFEDPALEEAVRTIVVAPDGPLMASQLGAVPTLFVRGAASLAGVECLPGLTMLRSVEGSLSDLSPLRELAQLETLILSDNEIFDVEPIANLPLLRSLDISRNPIENPTVLSGLPMLEDLRVDGCELEVLPEPGGPLGVLFASNNYIAILTPLARATTLRELRISKNTIVSLDALTDLTDLEVVDLEDNAITDLSPLAGKPRLERVMIGKNFVFDLTPLSNLPALQVIDADNNQISTLAGMTLPAPRCGSELDFTYNPITTDDLEHVCSQGWVTRWGTEPVQTCNAPCLQ